MKDHRQTVAFLHYSAPPVVGGVESVMLAHLRLFDEAGYSTSIIAGRGSKDALPVETDLIDIPEVDSAHPAILEISEQLEQGKIPSTFETMVTYLEHSLAPILSSSDVLIVHNVFTKHFNLPLTTALFRLLDREMIPCCVAWCHDASWASPRSRSKVFSGYPWDLLRTLRDDVTYVTVSQERQAELSAMFECPPEKVRVIYNGVDAAELLALSEGGLHLIERLGLWKSDLNLIMPVRVTKAKNIELGMRVVASLRQRGVRTKLIVTGPPDPHDAASMEYFAGLQALRKELDVVEEVRFVYESGRAHDAPFLIDMITVSELFRVSDALFMPSHREGFGMPVLEAGLLGMPVFSSEKVPAALEIGGQDIVQFSPEADANQIADMISQCMRENPTLRLRRHVRQQLTWQHIFQAQILPLIVRDSK